MNVKLKLHFLHHVLASHSFKSNKYSWVWSAVVSYSSNLCDNAVANIWEPTTNRRVLFSFLLNLFCHSTVGDRERHVKAAFWQSSEKSLKKTYLLIWRKSNFFTFCGCNYFLVLVTLYIAGKSGLYESRLIELNDFMIWFLPVYFCVFKSFLGVDFHFLSNVTLNWSFAKLLICLAAWQHCPSLTCAVRLRT